MGSVQIKGGKALLDRIRNMPKVLREEIDYELDASSKEIARNAKRDAPKDMGNLANGISSLKSGELKYEDVSAAPHSPYVEFGTGVYVDIPPGLADYAAQFKGGGGAAGGLSAKEAIYAWCKRHGIEESRWYLIYTSIMKKGIHPHPFFFRNIQAEIPKLKKRIENIVKSL